MLKMNENVKLHNSYNNPKKSRIQQKEAGRTNKQTEQELYLLILSYAGHTKYQTVIAVQNNISKS